MTEVIEFERYAAEQARMDREIAILKAAAPTMAAIDSDDLDRLAEVLNG